MFIAHLPGGYLLSRITPAALPLSPLLLGSVAPDFDILLILMDLAHGHHHTFLTHRPAIWLGLVGAATVFRAPWLIAFALGGLCHLSLDSVGGMINWAWPFGDFVLGLIDVPRRPGHWVLSFLLHPIFAVELMICAVAGAVWWQSKKKPRQSVSAGA